jgi:hypothetical protein
LLPQLCLHTGTEMILALCRLPYPPHHLNAVTCSYAKHMFEQPTMLDGGVRNSWQLEAPPRSLHPHRRQHPPTVSPRRRRFSAIPT